MCTEIPWGSISGSSLPSVARAWLLKGVPVEFALLWVCYILSLVLRCTDVIYIVNLTGSVFLMALHPYISKRESP